MPTWRGHWRQHIAASTGRKEFWTVNSDWWCCCSASETLYSLEPFEFRIAGSSLVNLFFFSEPAVMSQPTFCQHTPHPPPWSTVEIEIHHIAVSQPTVLRALLHCFTQATEVLTTRKGQLPPASVPFFAMCECSACIADLRSIQDGGIFGSCGSDRLSGVEVVFPVPSTFKKQRVNRELYPLQGNLS